MPADTEELLRGIAILADNHNMRVTMKQSVKGAAVCGAMCFVGGLVGGPVGLAVGGTLGGVTAYKISGSKLYNNIESIVSKDTFKKTYSNNNDSIFQNSNRLVKSYEMI